MSTARKPYPTDVADEEWAFAAPYLVLLREDAHQREYALRDVFDALRHVRVMPDDAIGSSVNQSSEGSNDIVGRIGNIFQTAMRNYDDTSAALFASLNLKSSPLDIPPIHACPSPGCGKVLAFTDIDDADNGFIETQSDWFQRLLPTAYQAVLVGATRRGALPG